MWKIECFVTVCTVHKEEDHFEEITNGTEIFTTFLKQIVNMPKSML